MILFLLSLKSAFYIVSSSVLLRVSKSPYCWKWKLGLKLFMIWLLETVSSVGLIAFMSVFVSISFGKQ